MKKIFTFLLVAGIGLSASAQQGYHNSNGYKNQQDKQWNDNHSNQQWGKQDQKGYNDKGFGKDDHFYNEKQQAMRERERREAIDRMNREYDQRIFKYRHDRSLKSFERDRRIAAIQHERDQKIAAFSISFRF